MDNRGEGVLRAIEMVKSHDLIKVTSDGLFKNFPGKGAIADIPAHNTFQGFEQARLVYFGGDPFREGDRGVPLFTISLFLVAAPLGVVALFTLVAGARD